MVYLDDLLVHDDFAKAVQSLGRPFLQEAGLGPVDQLGVVTADAEAASRRLEQKGLQAFFIAGGPVQMWTENGKDRDFRGRIGISSYQGAELELLEPGEGSNFYRQALDPLGRMTVHHLGFMVPDVDAASEKLTEAGCPLWVRGRIASKPVRVEFAYMDAKEQCGFVIEFITVSIFGKQIRAPHGLYNLLAGMQKKMGKRSWELNKG
ncbi:Glyoxalase/Bleomycin resistance protein/Dioxygenase superfamily protein [Desulfatibacillum alkenivorans DSM 16219]|jgi:hypothetical protein|uniref:Glyoxalase/Bleomycin resistance protein/Dioxygenase superfamily protein n=1 Tax=Desulfatibacillum alkenivorans DSM 16219 TaxID=1121393 RepID=A0A1M6KEY5_9BACT|nr:VOC family protein [Desulfatibacillum alkenivorans]SHJ57503.1 Glyoxalase/Bleomycin resistance protein/Dioxygenase superfamily protein [Desulfatibacillum alkenivorans DSM 16219]